MKKNTISIWGYVNLIIMVIVACVIYRRAVETTHGILDSKEMYYAMLIIFLVNSFFAIKSRACFIAHVTILFSFFIWLSFADVSYSPVDELLHFENANHIIDYHTLPTFNDDINYAYLNEANGQFNSAANGINYEAVQAPLYYIILATFGSFINKAYIRFHFFRLISLAGVMAVFCFVNKTVKLLEAKQFFKVDRQLYRLVLLLTIFNPGYLYRASRLNNETLVCILMAMLFYYAVKCIVDGYSKKFYWVLSFISSALFLTKNTAIYAYIILGLLAIYQKKIKEAVFPVCSGMLFTVPWFAFNMVTYGSLTSMKNHVDFVLSMINPQRQNVDIFEAFFSILPTTFFSAEEVVFSWGEAMWLGFFWFISLFVVINEFITIIKRLKTNSWRVSALNKKDMISVICVALLISAMLCLTAGTISTKICSIRGRYLYAPSIAIVFLMFFNYQRLSKKPKVYFMVIGIIIIAIVETKCITTFSDKVFKNKNIYASSMTELELSDLTDDNWKHGVGRYMPCVLVDNDGSNYDVLIGRHAIIADQGVLIQSVQEQGDYVWLVLNQIINIEKIDSNSIKLGDMYDEISINATTATIENNIEEQAICQEILVKNNGEIIGFEVMLGTYNDSTYEALVDYKVLENKVVMLTEVIQEIKNVEDNAYFSIYFNDPIRVQKDEKILLYFTIDSETDKPIALYLSENTICRNGKLYINGKELTGKEIALKIWASWEN